MTHSTLKECASPVTTYPKMESKKRQVKLIKEHKPNERLVTYPESISPYTCHKDGPRVLNDRIDLNPRVGMSIGRPGGHRRVFLSF